MNSLNKKAYVQEQQLQYKALKALVRSKHEIRINFSKSRAYRLLSLELQNHHRAEIITLQTPHQPLSPLLSNGPPMSNRIVMFGRDQIQLSTKADSLHEVINRQKNRLASFGWSEEKPLVRNSVMSRTFRKKKIGWKQHSSQLLQRQSSLNPEKGFTYNKTIQCSSRQFKESQINSQQFTEQANLTLNSFIFSKQEQQSCYSHTSKSRFSSHLPIKRKDHNLRNKCDSNNIMEFPSKLSLKSYQQLQQLSKEGKNQEFAVLQEAKPVKISEKHEDQVNSLQSSRKQINKKSIIVPEGQKATALPSCYTDRNTESACRPWSGGKEKVDQQIKEIVLV